MKPKEFEMFHVLPHESGVPWMSAKCCGGRINRCEKAVPLPSAEIRGQRSATHTQERRCKCGKTAIIFEGTMKTIALVGCFAFEKPAPPAKRGE